MVEDLNLTIYRNLTFSHWKQHCASNFIIEVAFTDPRKNEITLDCEIFISFNVGYMDPNVKKCKISKLINTN